MRTHATDDPGLRAAVGEVIEHVGRIARLELRMAIAELRQKRAALARGGGLGAAAAILVLFAIGFAGAAAAAGIATALSAWLALLIVAGAFAAGAAALGAGAVRALKRGSPQVPRESLDEARRTAEAVRGNGRRERT